MQVKKFEAPTIQEALETIKRELGPEAIILHTKQNRKGFGLMNKGSVEVTAAVSERSITRKKYTDTRLPDTSKEALQNLPADRQAEAYERYLNKHLDRKQRQKLEAENQAQVASSRVATAASRAATRISAPQPAMSGSMGMGMGMPADLDPAVNRASARPSYIDIEDEGANSRDSRPSSRAAIKSAAKQVVGVNGMTVEEELMHLKRMLHEIKEGQAQAEISPASEMGTRGGALFTQALREEFDHLVLSGLERRFSMDVLKRVGFELGVESAEDPQQVEEQIARELYESVQIKNPLEGIEPRTKTQSTAPGAVIALLGPTGVGKTTTIAKIASEAVLKRGLKVGLINLDSYKVAALDQLATYAKILNVPFRSASSIEDLRAAVQDFKSLDLILIDTTGRSQKDPHALKEMNDMLASVPGVQSQLVLSATTRDSELYDMANRFSIFKPTGLIFSKLDEASTFGSVLNTSQKAKLPLLYFTTGQRVPEDLEEATRERLIALLLGM